MTGKIVRQVAHVCIFARDLAETEEWYNRVLGMKTVFSFLREGKVIGFYLDAGGSTNIEVFENKEAEYSQKNRINHLCLETLDIDAAVAHIRAQGVEASDKSYGCDDTWQSWITDPNGTRIELFQYTAKSAQFIGGDRVATW